MGLENKIQFNTGSEDAVKQSRDHLLKAYKTGEVTKHDLLDYINSNHNTREAGLVSTVLCMGAESWPSYRKDLPSKSDEEIRSETVLGHLGTKRNEDPAPYFRELAMAHDVADNEHYGFLGYKGDELNGRKGKQGHYAVLLRAFDNVGDSFYGASVVEAENNSGFSLEDSDVKIAQNNSGKSLRGANVVTAEGNYGESLENSKGFRAENNYGNSLSFAEFEFANNNYGNALFASTVRKDAIGNSGKSLSNSTIMRDAYNNFEDSLSGAVVLGEAYNNGKTALHHVKFKKNGMLKHFNYNLFGTTRPWKRV